MGRRRVTGGEVVAIMAKVKAKTDLTSPLFLVLATVFSILLWFVPYAWVGVYPFRLFVTFIHEGGHAVAAILTGGSVEKMVIYADASGETYTVGGVALLIASAGYLTSAAYGATMLAMSRKSVHATKMLLINAAIILALTFYFGGSPFSWTVGIGLVVALALFVISASEPFAHFLLNFLAVQCSLNALYDVRTLIWVTSTTKLHNDAAIMEQVTLIPASIWAIGWAGLSLLFLVVGLFNYASGGRR